MKIGAIIQARLSSKRLPNKVLMPLPFGEGISAIEQIYSRLSKSKKIDCIALASSDSEEDIEMTTNLKKKGLKCYNGSLNDVLDRVYKVAKTEQLDCIVRITGDCPCLDVSIIDDAIEYHLEKNADFTTLSALQRSFPIGIDAAVIKFGALENAWINATHDFEREHVTPYFYKSNPDRFSIQQLPASKEQIRPDLRLTLDTKEDYTFLCSVYDYLYNENNYFGLDDILRLIDRKPWLKDINSRVLQKRVYSSFEEEKNELYKICQEQGFSFITELVKTL